MKTAVFKTLPSVSRTHYCPRPVKLLYLLQDLPYPVLNGKSADGGRRDLCRLRPVLRYNLF